MLFSADFYPTQEEAIAQLGQYFQSPEEDDVDESGILQVLHKVELKEADSEYLQARTANIMEKILEIDEKLNQAAAGWKTKRMGKVELTILRLALYEMLHDDAINPLFRAVAECVEESVLSSLLHAETVTGYHGRTVRCLSDLLDEK